MATIERIEQDIMAMEAACCQIATQLQSGYVNYLTTLGQSLQQQLILASYHLCTQGYPNNFLKLSLNQRQQLQQAIRKLGKNTAEELLTDISDEEEIEDELDELDDLDELDNLNEEPSPTFPNLPDDPHNPVEIAKWQQNLEEMTKQRLKTLSHEVNLLLQKARILPKQLPEPILEAVAAVSEASGDVMPAPPNLLNLVVEIENEQEPEDSSLTQIMAINLRLAEIEFADMTLSSARKQIRTILIQLNKLGREYQKKHHELSIAEAQAAWRASWFEN